MRLRSVLGLALAAGLLAVPAGPSATASAVSPGSAADCSDANPYPGDSAPKPAIAAWMARGAAARGIPGELPVMAALVESELVNLTTGSGDSKGYFQMREGIWGGTYPGFPDHPELQLDWFLDQAARVRTAPYPAEAAWGEWAADVERPATQNRYKYQLRLAEARGLIGTPCPTGPTAPQVVVVAGQQQVLGGHRLRVTVTCPAEPCTAVVRARLLLSGRPELTGPTRTLAAGQLATFKLRLASPERRQVTRALQRGAAVRVRFVVTTLGATGVPTVTKRRVLVVG